MVIVARFSHHVAVIRTEVRGYDGLIVDLDGVVWLDGHPIEGAASAIRSLRAAGTRILFLTNDPVSSSAEHAETLAAIGIPASAADVMTSAAALARFLTTQDKLRGRSVLVLGSTALRSEVEEAGFPVVPITEAASAEIVVIGGHPDFDFAELRAATVAAYGGAQLSATGRDAVVPTRQGPSPATGAILAAIETATGLTATVIGKPEPFIFDIARETLDGCHRIAVIGDNLGSDIAGAKAAGLDAILVLTGNSTEDDLAGAAVQPDLVLPRLASLDAAR